MDEFCGSKFWDLNVTWYTSDPDFTRCFQQTTLVWGPCAFLWVFSLMEIIYLRKSKNRDIPWSFLNVSKLAINILLVLLTAVDLVMAMTKRDVADIQAVHLYSPVIKLASFLYAAVLLYFNKRNGLQTSGLLWLFWFLLTICSVPQCRSEVRLNDARAVAGVEDSWAEYQFYSFMVYFAGCCAMLVLNCFADKPPTHATYAKTEKSCPELSASFLSRIFFSWFDSFAWFGFRHPLEHKDLWDMKPEDAAAEVIPDFARHWNKTIAKRNTQLQPIMPKATYIKGDVTKEAGGGGDVKFTKSTNGAQKKMIASILPALCKAFGPTFLFGALLKLVNDLLTFVSPQLLKYLIGFIGDPEAEDWKGYFFAISMFVVASVQTLVLAQYFNRMMFVGLRIRTALISAIYRKALIMSNSARKESTVGEIVNLMAVDAQRFMDLTAYINMIWSAPLQIGLALYFLWEILGPSVLAGLAVMIILIPVNSVIANKVKTLQIRQMKNKDERVKLMNEILSGIKVLKLYAWEPSFEAQVLKIRAKEVQVLKEQAYLNAGTSFIWSCAPFMVALVTFATFVLVDENNQLTATTAFVSIALFNILRFPMSMLPMLISNLVQTSVSVKRINKFMNAEELDPENVQHNEKESAGLRIENGTFSWDGDDTTLRNINMVVDRGSLVAVVGAVGSGKSSVVSSFLGEMERISGTVTTNGTIAYVSQQAWIQNATLKDNIIFGKAFDQKIYDRVVEACALKPDFEMLPAGDMTEIGEKGINLSGGQKQRVSLARAVYNDADIYFLDDPLSAVDSHVGKHIFEQVIGSRGLLAKKTRLLVTHGIIFLPETDNIYVMKDGEVSESGTYNGLLSKKGAFADFLIQHIQEGAAAEDTEDLNELKQKLESSIEDTDLRDKLERAISHRSRSESQSDTGSAKGKLSRQNSVDGESATAGGGGGSRKPSATDQQPQPKEEQEKDTLIEQEKAETGSVKWEVYKHYLKSIGVLLAFTTVALNMLFQGFSIGSNVWLARWSTDPNASNDTGIRDMYLGVYGALGFGQAIAFVISMVAMAIGAVAASHEMHASMLTNMFHWKMGRFDITPLGRILNRFSKDVDVVDNILPHVLRSWIMMFFSVVATLVVISTSTPIFIAVIVPIGILYYFVQRFYVATSRQLKRLESVSRSPIYSHFGETIQGAQTIRAYNVQNRFITESEEKVDFNQVCYSPSIIANRWLAIRLEMVGNLIILFAALFAVLDRESTDAGTVGLSVSYALQITQTLNWLVRMTSDVETNIVAVERIKEYGETEQEAAWENPNAVVPAQWPEAGTVEFKDFRVRYRENLDLVLRGITFGVRGGEKVGIVGRTGAGKSSLTLALFRIIESAGGKIMIDGLDISKLGLHTLRSRLTIIPQDPVLFSGSMRINLDPFNIYTDDDIWNALQHAHLKAFVKGLAAGLNHEVSEGGENLSVGQRQLVCLARALLRKTKVLILDEATAAVDLETDDLIQKTIRTEFKDCTVLTIAHRLNTIMDSDKVLVLDKGEIAEFDSPAALLQNKKSSFYSMAKDAGLV